MNLSWTKKNSTALLCCLAAVPTALGAQRQHGRMRRDYNRTGTRTRQREAQTPARRQKRAGDTSSAVLPCAGSCAPARAPRTRRAYCSQRKSRSTRCCLRDNQRSTGRETGRPTDHTPLVGDDRGEVAEDFVQLGDSLLDLLNLALPLLDELLLVLDFGVGYEIELLHLPRNRDGQDEDSRRSRTCLWSDSSRSWPLSAPNVSDLSDVSRGPGDTGNSRRESRGGFVKDGLGALDKGALSFDTARLSRLERAEGLVEVGRDLVSLELVLALRR